MIRHRAYDMLITASQAMQRTMAAAHQAAQSQAPLLIHGETGTGRRLLARFVHEEGHSDRRPLIAVRCDTLTVENTDRVMFGDPVTGSPGVLEQAEGGTLLLCNLEDLNPVAQERLLGVVTTETFITAAHDRRRLSCRIMATADESALNEQSRYGHTSRDLLAWISQSKLRMPSLDERREDIPKLVVGILNDFSQRERVTPPTVPYHYMELLMTVAWPENVRQLRNHVESVLALSDGMFDPEIIREHFQSTEAEATIRGALKGLWSRLNAAPATPVAERN